MSTMRRAGDTTQQMLTTAQEYLERLKIKLWRFAKGLLNFY